VKNGNRGICDNGGTGQRGDGNREKRENGDLDRLKYNFCSREDRGLSGVLDNDWITVS